MSYSIASEALHSQALPIIFPFFMKCPACGSFNCRVVTTKRTTEGPYEVVRRRRCVTCDHRWYTAQHAEVEITSDEMTWVGDEIKLKFHPLFGLPMTDQNVPTQHQSL